MTDRFRTYTLTYDQHRALMAVLATQLQNGGTRYDIPLDSSDRRHIEDVLALLRKP